MKHFLQQVLHSRLEASWQIMNCLSMVLYKERSKLQFTICSQTVACWSKPARRTKKWTSPPASHSWAVADVLAVML